jgi:hypothetical protein
MIRAAEPCMTIVTARPPKRRKPAQAATIAVSRIVQHTPRGRAWRLEALPQAAGPDPEAEARVAAFMARMIRPRS